MSRSAEEHARRLASALADAYSLAVRIVAVASGLELSLAWDRTDYGGAAATNDAVARALEGTRAAIDELYRALEHIDGLHYVSAAPGHEAFIRTLAVGVGRAALIRSALLGDCADLTRVGPAARELASDLANARTIAHEIAGGRGTIDSRTVSRRRQGWANTSTAQHIAEHLLGGAARVLPAELQQTWAREHAGNLGAAESWQLWTRHLLTELASLPDTAWVYWRERRLRDWASQRLYGQALLQSKVWFVASVLAATVGLTVIVWQVIQASNQSSLDDLLKAAPGVVSGAVGVLFYRRADAARKHAADLLTDIRSDHRQDTALAVLRTIEDPGCRDEAAVDLAKHLVGYSLDGKRRHRANSR